MTGTGPSGPSPKPTTPATLGGSEQMTDRQEFIEIIAETALYGGIGYWSQAQDVGPFGSRGNCTIREFDERTGEPCGEPINLIAAIRAGLSKARDPEVQINDQIRGWIVAGDCTNDAGDIDADCADVIVQLGAFGRIVYG